MASVIIVAVCGLAGLLVFFGMVKLLNKMAPPQKKSAAPSKESRACARFPLRSAFTISWRDSENRARVMTGYAVDLSQSGLSLKMDKPVEVGSLVSLRGKEYKASGEAWVRHCTRQGRSHVVGLQFKGALTRGA